MTPVFETDSGHFSFRKKKLFLSGQSQYPCTKNRMGGALGLAAGLPPNTDHVFSRYKRLS